MIYKSLLDIADNFDTFFFDAWGVFNIGGGLSQSAIAVMADLVARGKSVSLISNAAQTPDVIGQKYSKQGLIQGTHYGHIFSGGGLYRDAAARGELPVPGKRYYIAWNIDNPAFKSFTGLLDGLDYQKVESIDDADFVYCCNPNINGAPFSDEKKLEPELSRVIAAGLPVVCANPDMRVFNNGESVITPGFPCKIFEQRGLKVIYYGKPYPEIYTSAMSTLGDLEPMRTLMIGDTLETDILGATRAGIKTCLTLATGISADDLMSAGIALTEENIIAAGEKIGARVDYIIEKVPAEDL